MGVKDLIQKAVSKDAGGFEASFKDIMADKMLSAIETKYTSMFSPEEVSVEPDAETEA
jgi:hypothetical protein|tara:strand:- start:2427 stop:2600 length:174 start_codon:yes stop_codon:yes gene_type:complete